METRARRIWRGEKKNDARTDKMRTQQCNADGHNQVSLKTFLALNVGYNTTSAPSEPQMKTESDLSVGNARCELTNAWSLQLIFGLASKPTSIPTPALMPSLRVTLKFRKNIDVGWHQRRRSHEEETEDRPGTKNDQWHKTEIIFRYFWLWPIFGEPFVCLRALILTAIKWGKPKLR